MKDDCLACQTLQASKDDAFQWRKAATEFSTHLIAIQQKFRFEEPFEQVKGNVILKLDAWLTAKKI